MAVPVASPHNRAAAYAGFAKPRPLIPVPLKRSVEFRFQEFLDEAANAAPHPGFQGIEPIVPEKKRSFGRFSRRFYGIRFHGVISIGAPTPIRFEQTNWRLRHLQNPTTPATAPSPFFVLPPPQSCFDEGLGAFARMMQADDLILRDSARSRAGEAIGVLERVAT
jgi:hypothetical protein